jgi:serine/threonine-protein kinase
MGIATVAGRYALEGTLGRGGMGQVYRARHLELGKLFALKVIAPAFAGDEVARARFNQEAKLASEISHPNLVSVVDFGEDEHVGAYMVMELVEGTPLLEACEPPCSVKRALDVLAQLADVLEHVHKQGVVHGDIKAENVLLVMEQAGPRRRHVVRLIDFGLATRRGAIGSTDLCGTPSYLAPERAIGGPTSAAADLYALGVLGFLLLTGQFPFRGSVMETLTAHVQEPAPTLESVHRAPFDPAVEQLIARALAKEPGDRHKSAGAFHYELNAVMDMLAMERRRIRTSSMLAPHNLRESTLRLLFEHSTLPQAVISPTGTVNVANRAFAKLVAEDDAEGLQLEETALADHVPEMLDAIRTVLRRNVARELRARIDADTPFELVTWVAPFSSEAVHVLVRVESVVRRREAGR